MNQPSISVIIPTRNRLSFLREAMASVQAQSVEDWELIVVDDASEDGTWAWLQCIADGRVRALRLDQHRERSAARNMGLGASAGEFVLFLDDDDWLLDGALLHLIEPLRREPSAIAAVGALIYKNDWGSWNRAIHPRHRVCENISVDLFFGWVPLPGQTLFRRSAVIGAGSWNEALAPAEDNDLWLRLAPLGPAILIPQAVLGYRVHPGQTAKTGLWPLTVRLRQTAAAKRVGREKEKAERTILAHRMLRRAWRDLQRSRPTGALGWCCRAVGTAPWLLASPHSRATISEAALQSLTRSLLGTSLTGSLRKAKRACIRTLRGKLRSPRLGVVATKSIHNAGGHT